MWPCCAEGILDAGQTLDEDDDDDEEEEVEKRRTKKSNYRTTSVMESREVAESMAGISASLPLSQKKEKNKMATPSGGNSIFSEEILDVCRTRERDREREERENGWSLGTTKSSIGKQNSFPRGEARGWVKLPAEEVERGSGGRLAGEHIYYDYVYDNDEAARM